MIRVNPSHSPLMNALVSLHMYGDWSLLLLRLCLGERPPDEGTIKIGKKVVFNYIDQARMQLNGTGTVLGEGPRRALPRPLAGTGAIAIDGVEEAFMVRALRDS